MCSSTVSPGNKSAETQNAAQKHSVQRGHKCEARDVVSETGLTLRRRRRAEEESVSHGEWGRGPRPWRQKRARGEGSPADRRG